MAVANLATTIIKIQTVMQLLSPGFLENWTQQSVTQGTMDQDLWVSEKNLLWDFSCFLIYNTVASGNRIKDSDVVQETGESIYTAMELKTSLAELTIFALAYFISAKRHPLYNALLDVKTKFILILLAHNWVPEEASALFLHDWDKDGGLLEKIMHIDNWSSLNMKIEYATWH